MVQGCVAVGVGGEERVVGGGGAGTGVGLRRGFRGGVGRGGEESEG